MCLWLRLGARSVLVCASTIIVDQRLKFCNSPFRCPEKTALLKFFLPARAAVDEEKLDGIITVVPQNVADDPHGGERSGVNEGKIDGECSVFLSQTLT